MDGLVEGFARSTGYSSVYSSNRMVPLVPWSVFWCGSLLYLLVELVFGRAVTNWRDKKYCLSETPAFFTAVSRL